MKKTLNELTSRPHSTEERISELEDMLVESSSQKAKRILTLKKNRTGYPRIVGLLKKV